MTAPGRRSHPPSLLRLVERAILDHALARRDETLLVAVSGGADSTALLHTLAWLGKKRGFRVEGHGVDHGLRAEAPAELEAAAELARALEVPFSTTRVSVERGSNLQARARAARYVALAAAARRAGATRLAVAHTADDRAETVLLRLLRGAGPRGLAVLSPASPPVTPDGPSIVRPMILARRDDVLTHLSRHRLPFAEDPSNRDPRFLRVRVRMELLPLLASLSPGIVPHLNALATMLEGLPPDPLEGLGRAQRETILRAQRQGLRRVELRLARDRDVLVSFLGAHGVSIEELQGGRGRAGRSRKGDAHCSSATHGPRFEGGGVDDPEAHGRRSEDDEVVKSC